jgi:hypothetical protein
MTVAELLGGLSAPPHTKTPALCLAKLFLRTNRFEAAFGVPTIDSYLFDFQLEPGRADLVIVHTDHTATIVKFAGQVGKRALSAAIPRLILQAHRLKVQYTARRIRMILAATVAGAGHGDIDDLCRASGVRFIPMGPPAEHTAYLQEITYGDA